MKSEDTHNKDILGLYLHIPFCMQKCNYCDFLSFPVKESFLRCQNYVDALCTEICAYRYLGRRYELATIYFGGGTPSLLPVGQMEQLFSSIYKAFTVSKQAEITVECNPGTMTRDKLSGYQRLGVNRLSIGLQTTSNEQLRKLGRIHTYEQFLEQYQAAREVGFQNISVDLMSALPGQSLKEYEDSLRAVLALNPEHISSYGLIMEEGTPFYHDKMIWESLPDEELCVSMYERTRELLKEAGYEQYEISNYCKEGMYSRHNRSYWTGTPYLGVGLNAASYLQGERLFSGLKETDFGRMLRFRNADNMEKYLRCYDRKEVGARLRDMDELAACRYCSQNWEELVVLSDKDRMEEFVFLGLRKREGICLSEFEQQFHVSFDKIYQKPLCKHMALGNLVCFKRENRPCLALTPQGVLISNQVFVDFMF